DALWRIHELDNIDKHRTLFTLGYDFLFTAGWFPGAFLLKADNPVFSGVEVKVEQDLQLEIEKAVRQPPTKDANALIPTLQYLVDFVDSLADNFKPHLRNVYERLSDLSVTKD